MNRVDDEHLPFKKDFAVATLLQNKTDSFDGNQKNKTTGCRKD